ASVTATGGTVRSTSKFIVNFPVAPTAQSATLNFSIVEAKSAGLKWKNTSSIAIDLENGASQSKTLTGTGYGLEFTYQVVPVFSKANTLLVVPGDNSSLSSLPLGVGRYAGEQNFILLEVNDTIGGTGSLSVGSVPFVNSSAAHGISTVSYSVSLNGGMNNILVPRMLFKTSPLGEALLNMTFQNITTRAFQGSLSGAFAPGYWIARATGTTYAGVDYNYTQDPQNHAGYIKVYSNANQNCTGGGSQCGGIPGESSLDAVDPSYAIGAIFALNLSTSADLKDLLAGLLLNVSGNFTNWGFTATPYLPSLGLSSTVSAALANPVEFNQGKYGTPVYRNPNPPPTPWWDVGATIWNAVSGTVGALESVVWSAVQAAGAFVAYLATEVVNWGLAALHQVASALKAVADSIVYLVDQLLRAIIDGIQALLQAITVPVKDAMTGYMTTLWHDLSPLWAENNGSVPLNQGQLAKFVNDLFGTPFLIGLMLGTAVAVALVVIQGLSLGAGFLITLVIGLFTSAAIGALVAGLASLVPLGGVLTGAMVSSAWWMYNMTGGGSHVMTLSTSCASDFVALFAIIGYAFNIYPMAGDFQNGVDAIEQFGYVLDGYISYVAIMPIVMWALDVISIGVAIAAQAIGGGLGHFFNIIGLYLGAASLLIGFYLIAFKGNTLKEYDLWDDAISGELVGGLGESLNLLGVVSGCS
ncbi:MAG: hypothetical protein L3K03_00490, partial [Thermoplasmata archaeon]|nr:hypothetical protein [Thermoplasmata archaeon]